MIRTAAALRTAAVLTAVAIAAPAAAQTPLSGRDSFPLGSGGSLVCSAQSSALDAAYGDIFDRGYQVTCRDAAAPVARLYALRLRAGAPDARLATARGDRVDCSAAAVTRTALPDLGTVEQRDCRLAGADVPYRIYSVSRRGTVYIAEGLSGYDGVLRLGLRTLLADRPVPGDLEIASTGAGDPVAFARAQAGTLDSRRAMLEAYRRNNAGSFAEAGEFFGILIGIEDANTRAEGIVNQALQSSNLARYPEAEALFARAMALSGTDPVLRRRLRNYQSLNLLNQGQLAAALAELDRPIDQMATVATADSPSIPAALSEQLNVESPGRAVLDAASGTLRPAEKIAILDAQGVYLRGTILRLQSRLDEAEPLLRRAFAELGEVRAGVIPSTVWMRSQILGELAAISEARRQPAGAEESYRAAVGLLEIDYPSSEALLSARARLAAYFARSGQRDQALTLYRELIETSVASGTGSTIIRRSLEPYFSLLTAPGAAPGAAADLFVASQIVLRPGVAQTQALLARELSGGSDDVSRLFRQSVALTRDVERTRVQIARLANAERNAASAVAATELAARLASYEQAQVVTQSRLSEAPRYRVTALNVLRLSDLQQSLREGEAYYKLTVLGSSIYALLATRTDARAFRVDLTPAALEQQVDTLRATISLVEEGELVTYPFDIETARGLHQALFGPVAAQLATIRHLIFEPDGAMLRLPPNLLVESDDGLADYRRRAEAGGPAAFDFTGIAWFGRSRDISTAVAAAGFRDLRAAPPSRARNQYVGFGQNAPLTPAAINAGTIRRSAAADSCGWAFSAWNRPISAAELNSARQAIGRAGGGSEIVTDAAFSDDAIMARTDLDQFRVMHFATHGLITPPRPDCPARPSLLTSFGGESSDGLLSFGEIFDLQLDADLIILSACDTAGRADLAATAEAGLTSGGDFSLDGLVRAFVGAGGRLVVASHWPAPDAFDATERLISGLFTAPAGTGTTSALRQAQRSLMAEPRTSHPYYWAGFAVVGDGSAPVIRLPAERSAGTQ